MTENQVAFLIIGVLAVIGEFIIIIALSKAWDQIHYLESCCDSHEKMEKFILDRLTETNTKLNAVTDKVGVYHAGYVKSKEEYK